MNKTKLKQLAKSIGSISDELLVQLHEDQELYYASQADSNRQKVIDVLNKLDNIQVEILNLTHIEKKKKDDKDE